MMVFQSAIAGCDFRTEEELIRDSRIGGMVSPRGAVAALGRHLIVLRLFALGSALTGWATIRRFRDSSRLLEMSRWW